MEVKNIWAVYFSPGENTKKVVSAMAEGAIKSLNMDKVKVIDMTSKEAREKEINFQEGDLVFLGVPTYAGRVPNKIQPFIKEAVHGNGALGVPIVTYGNRSFDDSLMELKLLMSENGFIITGAAAMVCEHSFAETLAKGRPDKNDLKEAEDFGRGAAVKTIPGNILEIPGNNPPGPYYIPRGIDGEPAKFLKAVPKTDMKKCNSCGICADNCPMGSISREDFSEVTGICIKCQSCIIKCPEKAKYFDDPAFLSHKAMLEKNYSNRKLNNSFYI